MLQGANHASGATGEGVPSSAHARSRKTAGTSSAVSLSQYWNACTKVMLRMPPATTFTTTMPATSTMPTQSGLPETDRSVRPAPWNCGMR